MDMMLKTTELDKLWKRNQELLGVQYPIIRGVKSAFG